MNEQSSDHQVHHGSESDSQREPDSPVGSRRRKRRTTGESQKTQADYEAELAALQREGRELRLENTALKKRLARFENSFTVDAETFKEIPGVW